MDIVHFYPSLSPPKTNGILVQIKTKIKPTLKVPWLNCKRKVGLFIEVWGAYRERGGGGGREVARAPKLQASGLIFSHFSPHTLLKNCSFVFSFLMFYSDRRRVWTQDHCATTSAASDKAIFFYYRMHLQFYKHSYSVLARFYFYIHC